MKKNFFKRKNKYKKEDFKINIDLFWRSLIVVTLLLIAISFLFAYNLFKQVSGEQNLLVDQNSQKISSKEKEKIKNALDYFSEREKISAEILSSPAHVVDPSL
ncbi:MAG: hypothetical protein WCI93_03000 [bacterium]